MKRTLFILMISLLVGAIYAVSLVHVTPQTYLFGQDTQLMVEIQQGLEEISSIKVFYRNVGETKWMFETAVQKTPGAVYFWAVIPAKYLTDMEVEYYFEVTLTNDTIESFPPQDGLTPRYSIVPRGMIGELSPGFVLLSDDESASSDDGYLLAVSFFAIQDEIDPESIEVWVGGRNVTPDAQISAPTIVYRDEKPEPGVKKAVIRARQGDKDIHSEVWVSEILPGTGRRKIPFTYRGNVNFASNVYSYSLDDTFGQNDNDAATWTDLYGKYGIVDLQTSLYVSSLEKTNKQPVNRYTFGFQIPHLDIFAGDYSPMLSNYTLNNKNIKGLYAKLYTRFIGLIWAHGQSVRKTTNDNDYVSSIAGTQKSGTFKQEALGARLQIGNENETMMGITVSRHRDLVSSLEPEYYTYNDPVDGIDKYTVQARDNAVVSLDLRLNLPKQNVLLGAEVAGSILNKNTIPGAMTQADLDTLGFDLPIDPSDYSNLFVINKNMEPFIPGVASLAWTGYFRSLIWNNFLSVQYSQTGAAFNALGASYQMNDSQVLSFTDQINVYRYLMLSGGLNLTKDNLAGHKSETNKYTSWYIQSIIRYPHAPYLKAAFYNNQGENEDNPDIQSEFQHYLRTSKSMAFGIGYNINQIAYVPTQLDISYRMGFDDSKLLDVYQTDNRNNSINFTMLNRFAEFPLTTQFTMSLNNQDLKMANQSRKNQNFLLGAGYGFWENKIKPFMNYRMVSLGGDQPNDSFGYFTIGAEAYPIRDLSITTDLGFQNYSSDLNSANDYNNMTWRVLMTQRF